ncbi:hypothetical protein CF327_g6307 [Tilletia walkeri]|uniref:Uncharacterized protein n=1 Tax=Tilletia walkeri TaxID=117179 RepID=A0A8X7NDF9_9BASI|nr:hypothetical protein CF327_g6307 [Tilletia walkeri]KAE8271936.1 hypothetical protein A4X09_0g419 [Tilletia walkeri]
MSAPTAIPSHEEHQHHHQRQHSLGATSPRISTLGSAAFSFPRTGGQGVTTGPLHSPSQTRFSFSTASSILNSQSSPPKQQPSYFDSDSSSQYSSSYSSSARAKSASVSSSSTVASSEGPQTPRSSATPTPTTTSTAYDSAKSRVISQPWHPTLGSKWSGTNPPPPPPMTTSLSSRIDDASLVGGGGTQAEGQGRLGNLFRKLSLSTTSPNLPQMSTSTNAHPHHHHQRHHSMSIPPSFQRPSPPTMMESTHSMGAGGGVFAPGGSAIATDDLLTTTTNPSSTQGQQHPIARSEPSSSPVMMSSFSQPAPPAGTQGRSRKASIGGSGSRMRRPSPTGERLLSMGHFGHH